ncbi:UNVERIFIED_CONTAM: hypothetical protein DES50_1231 [Williamsia faeni]
MTWRSKSSSFFDVVTDAIYNYSAEHGIKWILTTTLGFSGTLVALGLLWNTTALRYIGPIVLIVVQFLIIIALLADRYKRGQRSIERSRVLNNYTEQITTGQQDNADLFEIIEWDEDVAVAKQGDTVMERWITVKNGNSELSAMWNKCNKSTHDQKSKTNSLAPTVRAYEFEIGEDGERKLGPRIIVTNKWVETGAQIAFLHFNSPVSPDQILRFKIEWRWPKYYNHLLDGQAEPVYWIFRRPVSSLKSRLHFDKECNASSARLSKYRHSSIPKINQRPAGIVSVEYDVPNPPQGQKFGYTIDISEAK